MVISFYLHPMIVHIPISFAVLGCFFALIAFLFQGKKNKLLMYSEYLLYLATLFSLCSVFIGKVVAKGTIEHMDMLRKWHADLAVLTCLLLLVTSLAFLGARFNPKKEVIIRKIGIIFYVLSAMIIITTGASGFALM